MITTIERPAWASVIEDIGEYGTGLYSAPDMPGGQMVRVEQYIYPDKIEGPMVAIYPPSGQSGDVVEMSADDALAFGQALVHQAQIIGAVAR